jgi:hypothetical protein
MSAWTDPKPYLNPKNGDRYAWTDAWPSMVNLDHLPRTEEQFKAEAEAWAEAHRLRLNAETMRSRETIRTETTGSET